jgi:hypothetical protein
VRHDSCLEHASQRRRKKFDSVADFQAAMKPHGKELFTDVQISEIIHS